MNNPDLKNPVSAQERALCDAYRFIRQRAAWLRAQKKAVAKKMGSKTQSPLTANTSSTSAYKPNS